MVGNYSILTLPTKADSLIIYDDSASEVKKLAILNLLGNVHYPDYNEADQGVAGSGSSVKTFVDAISTDSATLVFRHNSGAATTTYTFATSETIPSNINVIIEKGAILSIATAQILTINNLSNPGLNQVFSLTGTGKVDLSSALVKKVPSQWWGVTGDGTDETTELQAWLNCGAKGLYLPKPPTAYGYTGLTIPASTSNLYIVGENYVDVELRYLSATGDGITFAGEADNFHIENIWLSSSSSSTGWGIYSNQLSTAPIRDFTMNNCSISGFLKGIIIQGGLNLRIKGGRLSGQGKAVAGGISIQTGLDGTHSTNHAVIDQVYISGYQKGIYVVSASPVGIYNPIIENYTYGLEVLSAGTVYLVNPYFFCIDGNDVVSAGYVFSFTSRGFYRPVSITGNRFIEYGAATKLPVRVFLSDAQVVATGVAVQVALDSETYDTENHFASNAYTAEVPGYYNVKASVSWNCTANGRYQAWLYKNAAAILVTTQRIANADGGGYLISLQLNDVVWLDVGDTIKLYAQQSSGVNQSVNSGATETYLIIQGI
jgi:hypothetical protein